jgi:hypothetical protein
MAAALRKPLPDRAHVELVSRGGSAG